MVRHNFRFLHDGVGILVQSVANQRSRRGKERSKWRFGSWPNASGIHIRSVITVVLKFVEKILNFLRVYIVDLRILFGVSSKCPLQVFRFSNFKPSHRVDRRIFRNRMKDQYQLSTTLEQSCINYTNKKNEALHELVCNNEWNSRFETSAWGKLIYIFVSVRPFLQLKLAISPKYWQG